MLRITAARLARDVVPASAPEAGDVARRLDRAVRGRGQREDQRHRRFADAWVAGQAEQFLHPHRDGRPAFGTIVDRVAAARGSQIGKHTSELQSLMRISYAGFCLKKKKKVA